MGHQKTGFISRQINNGIIYITITSLILFSYANIKIVCTKKIYLEVVL
jgi:hypothetical protein